MRFHNTTTIPVTFQVYRTNDRKTLQPGQSAKIGDDQDKIAYYKQIAKAFNCEVREEAPATPADPAPDVNK